ncbi:MAG: hypothetical protein F4Y27_04520 [Acidimicrobiaceae bacterium]|nr:hypothetical protein [Acidimicrobiaceae bacterium]MXW61591.1 hypothetical protein [Acidimicrobiaceae bacterium]MXW75489.1 hypothetical protein [Acidimicrobiaceae bacterium]MYA73920.1 hypothetical protein [Acidimicrobiaceae bacterium]MYC42235.1 hypothetical protein [Acidimicrobiaceae bacterium]
MVNADAPDTSALADEPSATTAKRNISRRQVLRLGSGGALGLVIGAGAGWFDRARDPSPKMVAAPTPTPAGTTTSTTTTAAPVTVTGIGEVDPRIITLGQRVVEVTGENDITELLAKLPAADQDGDPLERAAARVRTDFETSDTITVDGWILAASEARAAAVIALFCSESAESKC